MSTDLFTSTPPSDDEVIGYYGRLPSSPRLLARTGKPWNPYDGTFSATKELRVVGDHKIKDVWEDDLALKVHAALDEKGVDWSCTDVVRIWASNEPDDEILLWIGVNPGTIPYEPAMAVALDCKRLLADYGLEDVEVGLRESQVTHAAGPRLFEPTPSDSFDEDFRTPFTTTLGTPICSQHTPWIQGTGGFFLDEDGDGKRLLLVTARHVVIPTTNNFPFEHKSSQQRRHNVLLFNDGSFQKHLLSISKAISREDWNIEHTESMRSLENARATADIEKRLERARKVRTGLSGLHEELSTQWASEDSRIMGHLVFAPPLDVGSGAERYTQDVSVIDIDASKIDQGSLAGNFIDLGPQSLFNPRHGPFYMTALEQYKRVNRPSHIDHQFFHLDGIIPDEEMRKPEMNDESERFVLKRGAATDLTRGHANNVFSYVRKCFGQGVYKVSKEWAILPFDRQSRAFSATGDSGSVVVDSDGRIGGMITGGSGGTDAHDHAVTYVTPISFVLKVIRANKSFANVRLKQPLS